MSDILAEAREQVLERGEGLNQEQTLRVLQLPDDRLDELLALAHEVRMAWCGPDVEVEGIISLKTGGCPEDCHFCSQSGLFASPVRSAWLDVPGLVEAARQTAKTGATVLHRRCRPRTRRAAAGTGRRGHRGDPQRGRHPDRVLAGHADPRAGRAALRDGRAPLQPQPRDRAVVLHQCRHHPHVGGALGHAADGPRGGHGGVLRWHLGMGETLEQRARFAANLAELDPHEVPLNFLNPRPGTPFGDLDVLPASEALKAVAAFRLALPRTMLRFAGGREITLGDLGAKKGILGGINAVIVGNYLTTLGRPAEADLELLDDLQMPIKALNASL